MNTCFGAGRKPKTTSKTCVSWYDYGARFYDPQLGRFHTKDPLMEWHFNYTPYHYCFNSPVNLIDPFGLDTTYIAPPMPEAIITTERPNLLTRIFRKIVRALSAGDDLVTGDPEPYKETIVDDGVDMDWYKSEESYGNQDVISRDNPKYEKIFDDNKNSSSNNSNSKDNNTNQTSDKKITENNTGSGEKTDDKGIPVSQTLKQNKKQPSYYGWRIVDHTTTAVRDSNGNWVDVRPGDTIDQYSNDFPNFYYKVRK